MTDAHSVKEWQMNRIAVICCDYPLHTATLILNTIEECIERGMRIDIFCSSPTDAPEFPASLPVSVKVYRENFFAKVFRKLSTFPVARHILSSKLVRDIAKLSPYWASFARYIKRVAFEKYDHIFCISYPALFCFGAASPQMQCIYFNMELLDDTPNITGIYIDKALCRSLEKRCMHHVTHAVAMSPDRARLFQHSTQMAANRISVLPILPRLKELDARSTSDFFRTKFSLTGEQKIVVYSGGIGDWGMLAEIISTVASWPEEYVFIIHTWQTYALQSAYGKYLQELAQGLPVFFSVENLPRPKLIDALSAADIGIAYYRDIDDNFTNIVFSSNKLSEYLLAGIPVICSPFPSLKAEIDKYQVGKAVSVEEIPVAIREIATDGEAFKKQITKAVRETLNFDRYFDKFYRNIIA